MTSRLRALLVVLAALAALLSTGSTAASAEGGMVIGGVIDGSDGRAVNALIGIDLQDASGQVLDKNGCVRSPECPVNSYGVIVNVNRTLPPEGSADTSTATISWTAEIPQNAATIYIEVYPKNERGVTTESRYGHAMRHSVRVPTTEPLDLHLPLICSQGGSTGTIRGTATKDGAPVALRRAITWSIDRYDPVQRPTLGWNIGTTSSDGTYVIPNLPSGQRYQVWTTTTDGQVHKEVGVSVSPCADTISDVSFDPPPPNEPPPPPPPPTIEIGHGVITAGGSANLSGAAEPGTSVELYAYSRPSTDFVLVRRTTATSTGSYLFTVSPHTNTRLKVRINGQDSESVVVGVRPALSLRAVRTAVRTYTFTGSVLPRRQGQLVSVFARTPNGDVRVGRGAVDASGVWRAAHRFTVNGTYALYASTTGDLTSAAGRSADIRVKIS